MENEGIIYISSGDEIEPEKEKCKTSPKVEKPINVCKIKNDTDNNQKTDTLSQKRKASQMNDFKAIPLSLSFNKKIKMTVENALIAIDSLGFCKDNKEEVIGKPKLVVKERVSLPDVAQDTFPQFISLCLQKDRSEDMNVIVNKLKRRYEQLEPSYATSETFITFLNEKRNAISANSKKLYTHIFEVMNYMKKVCKKDRQLTQTCVSDNSMEEPPIVSSTKFCKEIPQLHESNEQGRDRDKKHSKELRMLSKVMKKCEKRIAELEEEEVDFSEETDSSYIKVEKYKRRMVELWNRYCKLTGENPDAGRSYLRPKHLSATRIVAVDQAITNFINSQLTQKNKFVKIGGRVNALIFPDYADILECISQCNESHNLALDKKKQQQIAKRAFLQLGEHLQRARQNDYWDTFSLFLENKEDDPAAKNADLAEKLNHNRRIGEKKLTEVFEEFVKKQDLRQTVDSESTSSDREDEESTSAEEKTEDGNDVANRTSSEEDGSDTDVAEGKSNATTQNTKVAEVGITRKLSTDSAKTCPSKHKDRRSTTEITVPLSTATAEKDSGVILITDESKKVIADSNKDLPAAEVSKVQPNSELICETVMIKSKSVNSVANDNGVTKAKIESKTQLSGVKLKKLPIKLQEEILPKKTITLFRTAAKGTEETVAVNVPDESKSKTDCHLEEEKPLLRVRSFAKPPMTWKDECQRTDKTNGIALNVLKDHCDKNANVTNKLPSDESAPAIGTNGNQTKVIFVPVASEQGENEKNLTDKQNDLIKQIIKMSNGVPKATKLILVRKANVLQTNLATLNTTSK